MAPLVLLALLWSNGTPRTTAARLPAARHHKGVVPAIRQELPDGVQAKVAKPKPAPPKPKATPSPVRRHAGLIPIPQELPSGHSIFSGLGAWVDLFDVDVLPLQQTIDRLRANGVQTLYLETGLSSTRHAVEPSSVKWLVAAHRAGLKVVGWYLPYYANLPFDTARTVAVARFSFKGIHFDGVGVDIEWKGSVPNNRKWNSNIVRHMNAVRRVLGPDYPLAAIPPPPLQMRVAPALWAGFPWKSLARVSSEFMLMSYWSDRGGCPRIRLHCAYDFTLYNVLITRQLTGGKVPIHIIGGIGDSITPTQLVAFIKAAEAARADGASIYDVGTTNPRWWRSLRFLASLGQ